MSFIIFCLTKFHELKDLRINFEHKLLEVVRDKLRIAVQSSSIFSNSILPSQVMSLPDGALKKDVMAVATHHVNHILSVVDPRLREVMNLIDLDLENTAALLYGGIGFFFPFSMHSSLQSAVSDFD